MTTHHCLFTGNIDRNPIIGGPQDTPKYPLEDYLFDIVNNVIYNYWNAAKFGGYARVNLLSNYFRPGPDSSLSKWEVNIMPKYQIWESVRMEPQLFCKGNIGPHRKSDDLDELSMAMIYGKENKSGKIGNYGPEAETFIAREAFSELVDQNAAVRAQPAGVALRQVLDWVGAWPRDEVDQRLVGEVRERKGMIGRVGPRWRQIDEEFQKRQKTKQR